MFWEIFRNLRGIFNQLLKPRNGDSLIHQKFMKNSKITKTYKKLNQAKSTNNQGVSALDFNKLYLPPPSNFKFFSEEWELPGKSISQQNDKAKMEMENKRVKFPWNFINEFNFPSIFPFCNFYFNIWIFGIAKVYETRTCNVFCCLKLFLEELQKNPFNQVDFSFIF